MLFELSTVEKIPQTHIEFTNPRSYDLVKPTELIEEHVHFSATKYTYARDMDTRPAIAAFFAQAKFHVSLYNQHASRNPSKDKSPSVCIYFRDSALGKSISLEAFIQCEFLTSAVLLARQSTQIDFSAEISDETILGDLEEKLAQSKSSDYSVCEVPDKFKITFL